MLKNIYKKYRWAKREGKTSKALRDKAKEKPRVLFLSFSIAVSELKFCTFANAHRSIGRRFVRHENFFLTAREINLESFIVQLCGMSMNETYIIGECVVASGTIVDILMTSRIVLSVCGR